MVIEKKHAALLLALLLILGYSSIQGQVHLISGKVDLVNSNVRIAISPSSGNALIVWCQSDFENNDYGRVYASEVFQHPDGAIEVGEPVMVSPDSGSHQRPSVTYIEQISRYLIVWDTSKHSLENITENGWDSSADVLARFYTPRALAFNNDMKGDLKEIFKVSGHNNIQHAFGASIIPVSADGDLLITYTARQNGAAGDAFELMGSVWTLSEGTAATSNYSGYSLSRIFSSRITPEEFVVINSGFYMDGDIYAIGASIRNSRRGQVSFFHLDSETLQVTEQLNIDTSKAQEILNSVGNVFPLPEESQAFESGRQVVGFNSYDPGLFSVDLDLNGNSLKDLGSAVKEDDDLILQKLFSTRSCFEDAGYQIYSLYYTSDNRFRYKKLSDISAKPKGGAKTALSLSEGDVAALDVACNGESILLVFSDNINRKKSRIYLHKFELK